MIGRYGRTSVGIAIAHPAEFDRFVMQQAEALNSLLRIHSGYIARDDLISEAWLLAMELGVARNFPLNLSEPEDETLLLRELKSKIRRLTSDRYLTASLDQPIGGNQSQMGVDTWHRILAAPESADPLNILVQVDVDKPDIDWLQVARTTYSEVSAYILLLVRFSWDRNQLAMFLAISPMTLVVRLGRAIDVMRRQSSLFDGIEEIHEGFRARIERYPGRRTWVEVSGQLALIN